MVAFSYDMVGYNDTRQVDHNFAANPTNQLWQISLMGLQTWNSIRALDFLSSLADVDQSRLACTGESGGGTQTFMLGSVDDRLAAQAPIVMVSHSMQGGCLCENAPGLRVTYSNMEIAAQAAPRRQILVAASGDWTKDTMTVEGPSIERIYKFFGAADQFEYHRFNFGHNYNRTSRQAVYTAFDRWLLKRDGSETVQEIAFKKEPDAALKVFPGELPKEAKSESEFIQSLIAMAQTQFKKLEPDSVESFQRFRSVYEPAWRHSLQVSEVAAGDLETDVKVSAKNNELQTAQFLLSNAKTGQELPCVSFVPNEAKHDIVLALAHPDGIAAFLSEGGQPKGMAALAASLGVPVIAFDAFGTGALALPKKNGRNYAANYFTTYNKTDSQERAQDIAAICAYARKEFPGKRVALCGIGRAGLWALLAAPSADLVAADCDAIDETSDAALLAQDIFTPGLRRLGSFQGIASLIFPKPILLHNTGSSFEAGFIQKLYKQTGKAPNALRLEPGKLDGEAIVKWIAASK
jgi:dienelactone hydrolase